MYTIWIVVLVLAALVVIGVVMYVVRQRSEARLEERRLEAQSHREEANATARRAEKAQLEAKEQAEVARREQESAAELRQRADEVDPDVDTDAADERDEVGRR